MKSAIKYDILRYLSQEIDTNYQMLDKLKKDGQIKPSDLKAAFGVKIQNLRDALEEIKNIKED